MNDTKNETGYTKELSEFRTHFTIHCPSCNKKTVLSNKRLSWFLEGRIACSDCGFCKDFDENSSYLLSANEGIVIESKTVLSNPKGLKLLLWYSANFKGNSFWAYNEIHLQFLYDFISAKQRARSQMDLRNRSIGSRLPKWMTSAVNREDVRKIIEKML